MSVPSSQNATELAAYMHGKLGRVAAMLGFSTPANYQQAITDTLIAYGVADIGSATNVPRLLALASVEVWRLATQQLAPQINTTTDGRSQNRRELFEHCQAMLDDAQTVARQYPNDGTGAASSGNSAGRVFVRYCDPYS